MNLLNGLADRRPGFRARASRSSRTRLSQHCLLLIRLDVAGVEWFREVRFMPFNTLPDKTTGLPPSGRRASTTLGQAPVPNQKEIDRRNRRKGRAISVRQKPAVSTEQQNLALRKEELRAGCRRVIEDQGVSGARPAWLNESSVRSQEGRLLLVWRRDRWAVPLAHLSEIMGEFRRASGLASASRPSQLT